MALYKWRISIFGKTPAIPLGTVKAPDEATAGNRVLFDLAESWR
jgi:hypothetical protein